MKYSPYLLLSVSVLIFVNGPAQADNSVLSPIQKWELINHQNPAQSRGCSLTNVYENQFSLGFASYQSRIKEITFQTHDTKFNMGDVFAVDIRITPGYAAKFDATAKDENTISVDVSGDINLFSALRSALIISIEQPSISKTFSLTGLKGKLGQLQSCSTSDWNKNIQVVSFNESSATNQDARDEPLALNAFPKAEPLLLEQTPSSSAIRENSVAASKAPENDDNVTPKIHFSEEPGSIPKRIHKPSFVIEPPSDDLIKPPSFEPPTVVESPSDVEEEIVLARKNDSEQEIFWDGKNLKGQPKRILSQSEDASMKAPVIVRAIDDNPKRIDLMDRDNSKTFISNEELERQVKIGQPLQRPEPKTSTVATSEPKANSKNAVPAAWSAQTGDSLREVLAQWSLKAGVEMIWDSQNQFSVLENIAGHESYEDAIASLLSQYMSKNMSQRPVGQLYVDPQDDKKVLIIQTN